MGKWLHSVHFRCSSALVGAGNWTLVYTGAAHALNTWAIFSTLNYASYTWETEAQKEKEYRKLLL